MSNHNLVDRLRDSEDKTYRIGIKVQQTITNQAAPDARVLAFYNLAAVIRSSKIYFILQDEYLQYRQWYVDNYLKKWRQQWPTGPVRGGTALMLHNDHEQLNKDYDQVTLIGYTQALFSIIDSKFRLFTSALDPNACNEATDNFYKIYHWLLDPNQIDKLRQYENFLTFFSHMRNTIHHNGKHMNKKYPGKPINYHGTTYNFVYGQPVIYPNPYELLYLEITPDVIDMMEDIILHPKILNLSSVPDPMA